MVFSEILKSCRSSLINNYKSRLRFATELDFKDIRFPVNIRDIHKIQKKNSIGISVFGYENKKKSELCI